VRADCGPPCRYDAHGYVVAASRPKQTQLLETAEGEQEFVLESAIVADFGRGDP
jgi:3-oxoacid CoA-transferase subunit A